MTHCNVSVAITVWAIMTKTQDIIFTTAGAVADLRGVKGVQMHPPLVASNVFLRTYLHESIK